MIKFFLHRIESVTYLLHEAAAEVSNHREPI